MDDFLRLAFCGTVVAALTCDRVAAQRVFSNSRAAASANPANPRTATGGFSIGRSSNSTRWGIPGAPARTDWNLRPTYSNSRSTSSRYDAASGYRGNTRYSTRPPVVHYSTPHVHPHAYGHYGGPVIYGAVGYGHRNYGGLSPYDQVRILNGLPPRYSWGNGGYVSIATPPIIVPYGGIGIPSMQQVVPVPLNPAPLPGNSSHLPSAKSLPQVPESNDSTLSREAPVDERPVIDEFPVRRPDIGAGKIGAVDRIRSLRYQTSGDGEFRRKDYAAAAAFYETSAKTAPERRAPLLRKAWAKISLQQFDEAAKSLKAALMLEDDPTSSWIPGEQLYGAKFASEAALQNDALWKWLQQRPNSTDRLLLTAAFQQLQGYTGTARELLNAAMQKGLQRNIVDSLQEIVDDDGKNGDAQQNAQTPPSVDATDTNRPIRDSNVTGAGLEVEERPGLPLPVETDVPGSRIFTAPRTLEPSPKGDDEFSLTIPVPE